MNNITIPSERGFPFQLVAESKWGYKWIKWITEINLSSNQEYRGFWESVGYSNDGDLSENYLENGIPEFPSWTILVLGLSIVLVLSIIYRHGFTPREKK